MHLTIKINNRRKLKIKVLINSECTHPITVKETVEEKKIPTKQLPKPFNVYNLNRSRNEENTFKEFIPLEINSNRHIEQINTGVLEIKKTDLFLEHNWLVEYNPEVD